MNVVLHHAHSTRLIMAHRFGLFLLMLSPTIAPLFGAEDFPQIHSATTEQIEQTVDRALGYIKGECEVWLKSRKCAACHHVPMPLWAMTEAAQQGYTIDTKFVEEVTESLLGSEENLFASRVYPNPADAPDPRPSGRGLNMGMPFLAVAAHAMSSRSEAQKYSLRLITERIVEKQQPDGSWEFFANLRRPPINETQSTDVAWITLALHAETGADSPESHRVALTKAIDWLKSAKLTGIHQDAVFKVLLGTRLGIPREEFQPAIDELIALQRTDGGWSQTVPEPKSDAFATGQTLYVLSLVGNTANRPEIRRGIDFLVTTQSPDGSWPMVSRSTPGGSEGSSKLLTPILTAAGSWATLSLSRLSPKN
jgi:hypothetical protein